MKRTTFNILFFIKKSKLLKNGTAPIYMRVTLGGVRSEISIKRSVLPSNWDTIRNRAKGKLQAVKELNDYLNSIRGQIYSHQQSFQENGKNVTAKGLTNAFLGVGERNWSLIELFTEHNNKMERLVGTEFAPLTLQRYKSAFEHIKTYCKLQYNNVDFQLSEVNHKFITGFDFYLKTVAKCQHNSSMKHIKALKKITRIALANDYIRKDPFANFKITQSKVDRDCLSDLEIKVILEKKFDIKRIEVVRDLFIFQCYTGLAYRDLANLKKEHLQLGIDGHKWIILKRGKTGVTCRVPILKTADLILHKYKDDPCHSIQGKLLPVLSNQRMNAYLKEIGDLCGIKKKLHTHLARHTFATTVILSNGISMEVLSKMLGHSKQKHTQIYGKVLDTKISSEIESLRNKNIG